jgi:hypothetical protein
VIEQPKHPLTDLVQAARKSVGSIRALLALCVDPAPGSDYQPSIRRLHKILHADNVDITDELIRALAAGMQAAGLDVTPETVEEAADAQYPRRRTRVGVDPFPDLHPQSIKVTMSLPENPTPTDLDLAERDLRHALAMIDDLRRDAREAEEARRSNKS